MSIKLRLVILVVLTNLILILSVLYVDLQHAQIERIRKEQQLLADLQNALSDESIFLGDFLLSSLGESIDNYEGVVTATTAAFDTARKEITVLPTLSDSVQDSLESVYRLNDLVVDRRTRHKAEADDLMAAALENYTFVGGASVFRLASDDVYRRGNYERIESAISDFVTSQSVLHSAVVSSLGELGEQIDDIAAAVGRISTRQNWVMNLGFAFAVVISIILSILTIRVISRKIDRIHEDVGILSTGNLTSRITVDGRDEIAGLAIVINRFVDLVRDVAESVQQQADSNRVARDDLVRVAEDSVGSVDRNERNTEAILELTARLDDSVKDSAASAAKIVQGIESLAGMMESQSTMVEESTAAMTEIAASLDSMASNVSGNKKSAEALGEASMDGSSKVEETSESIKRVRSHVDAIQEMADLIKGVAEQANILAMNAAIEAAHAGEAGRGFGVVADEIRRLAEATAENSHVISENLNAIIADIAIAADTSAHAVNTFDRINAEVKHVIDRVNEVASSIEELGAGGGQVRTSMNQLREFTLKIKDNAGEMTSDVHLVRQSVNVASEVSNRVRNDSEEIRRGIEIIRDNLDRNREVALTITEVGRNLDLAAKRFKLDGSPAVSSSDSDDKCISLEEPSSGVRRAEDIEELPLSDEEEAVEEIPVIGSDETTEDRDIRSTPPETLEVPINEEPPNLKSPESDTILVEEGVTLSEGEWPGKDRLVLVDEEGNTTEE